MTSPDEDDPQGKANHIDSDKGYETHEYPNHRNVWQDGLENEHVHSDGRRDRCDLGYDDHDDAEPDQIKP